MAHFTDKNIHTDTLKVFFGTPDVKFYLLTSSYGPGALVHSDLPPIYEFGAYGWSALSARSKNASYPYTFRKSENLIKHCRKYNSVVEVCLVNGQVSMVEELNAWTA